MLVGAECYQYEIGSNNMTIWNVFHIAIATKCDFVFIDVGLTSRHMLIEL